MKNISTLCVLILLISVQLSTAQFQFVSPRPGSKNLNPEHCIILREGNLLNAATLSSNLFTIHGSVSGNHEFIITLAADEKTINLKPLVPFAYNEEVTVSVSPGLARKSGCTIGGYSFKFNIRREHTPEELLGSQSAKKILQEQELKRWGTVADDQSDTRDIQGMFSIPINIDPSPGHIFYDAFSGYFAQNDWTGYHVVSNDGDSIYSKEVGYANDFKLNKSGNFGVYNGTYGRFETLDSNFSVIDKVYPANGYYADNHEYQLLPNGNKLFIAQEFQTVDMTIYDPNYSPYATVFGTVIQELDADDNLLFEWRGFDHVEITEAWHENLAYSYIDYLHTNSVELDDDGNIFCSHRHLDQITKIDRNTGEFIWRLGGQKGDITFINEPEPFNYQHDARRIANGNITVFDNGNWHPTAHSSVKEYQLDEVNKTATLVWKYSHPNGSGGYHLYWAMGSGQRLPNGNTFINWGWRSYSSQPSMSEVTPDGAIVWELKLQGPKNMLAYRSHKYVWDPCARPTFKKMNAQNITDHSAKLKWADVANNVEYHVQYKKHNESTWTDKVVSGQHYYHAYGLDPETKYDWKVSTWCAADGSKISGYTDIRKFTTLAGRAASLSTQSEIMVYPNPAQDWITLQLNSLSVDQVSILNVLGMEVMKFSIGGQVESQIQIPLQNLLPGNYFVELTGTSGRVIEKLVVE